jgi:hypothetical protein
MLNRYGKFIFSARLLFVGAIQKSKRVREKYSGTLAFALDSTYTLAAYCGQEPTMKRTTIWLTEEQIKRLGKVAASKAINPAQLIRIYINAGLAKEKS